MASDFAMLTCRWRQEWGFWAKQNWGERKLTIFSKPSCRPPLPEPVGRTALRKVVLFSRPWQVPVTTHSLPKQTCKADTFYSGATFFLLTRYIQWCRSKSGNLWFAGYTFTKKDFIVPNLYEIHHDPKHFHDPGIGVWPDAGTNYANIWPN